MAGIKIRAKAEGDVTTVKALMQHPMDVERKDKKTGEVVPGYFIKEVKVDVNGKTVMVANWGQGVSKNPYLSFKIKGAKAGDTIKLSWTDSKGKSESVEDKVQ
jgi:sulfur-oxidizing protein SoxZ